MTKLAARLQDAERGPLCPPETAWDGVVCAHARATCGAWDGLTCDPHDGDTSSSENSAAVEFERIDSDATTVCRKFGASSQAGTVGGDVLKAVDAALGELQGMDKRLAQLRDAQPRPRWAVATLALEGRMYDCIRVQLHQTPPVYTAQQQALLNKLQRIVQQLQAAGAQAQANAVQAQLNAPTATVNVKLRDERDRYLYVLAVNVLRFYVRAALVARRYALEEFDLARARERLADVVSTMGTDAAHRVLQNVDDPTDPTPDRARRRSAAAGLDGLLVAP